MAIPVKMRGYFWLAANVAVGLLALLFLYLFWNDLSKDGQYAIENGKQVRLDLETGDVAMRALEPEELVETDVREVVEEVAETDETSAEEVEQPSQIGDSGGKLAVVFSGVGLQEALMQALYNLPQDVVLSFSPYATAISEKVEIARARGHQVLLDLPMEAESYPFDDPGPFAMSARAGKARNMFRLKSLMERTEGFSGVLVPREENVTQSLVSMVPVMEELAKRGKLMAYQERGENAYLAGEAKNAKLPLQRNLIWIDATLTQAAIDAQLSEVTQKIASGERVVVAAQPKPLTITRINQWLSLLEDSGVRPGPISLMVE